jgi:hypothetical protein
METSNIGRAARHCTGTLHDHVVGACIQMRLESASIHQSRVAPLKHNSPLPDYQRSRALSRLVAVGGEGATGIRGPPLSRFFSQYKGGQCQDAPIADLHY